MKVSSYGKWVHVQGANYDKFIKQSEYKKSLLYHVNFHRVTHYENGCRKISRVYNHEVYKKYICGPSGYWVMITYYKKDKSFFWDDLSVNKISIERNKVNGVANHCSVKSGSQPKTITKQAFAQELKSRLGL